MERKTFKYSGYPTIGEKIELPNIAGLLSMPWFQYASADDVYKYGGEINRKLLNETPIKGDRKYVLVTSRVQYISPIKMSIKYLGRWHTDGSGLPLMQDKNDLMHLLISKCTAVTEFNSAAGETEALPIDIKQWELNHYLEKNKEALGLQAKPVEAEKMISFDWRHVHRAITPTEQEFRFMWRVIESDVFVPASLDKTHVNMTYSYGENPDGSQVAIDYIEKSSAYASIVKNNGRIIINM